MGKFKEGLKSFKEFSEFMWTDGNTPVILAGIGITVAIGVLIAVALPDTGSADITVRHI